MALVRGEDGEVEGEGRCADEEVGERDVESFDPLFSIDSSGYFCRFRCVVVDRQRGKKLIEKRSTEDTRRVRAPTVGAMYQFGEADRRQCNFLRPHRRENASDEHCGVFAGAFCSDDDA